MSSVFKPNPNLQPFIEVQLEENSETNLEGCDIIVHGNMKLDYDLKCRNITVEDGGCLDMNGKNLTMTGSFMALAMSELNMDGDVTMEGDFNVGTTTDFLPGKTTMEMDVPDMKVEIMEEEQDIPPELNLWEML